MKIIIYLLLMGFPLFSYSQQDSKISIDSGNNNDISVTQEGTDSSQKSNIHLGKGDSNKVHQKQKQIDNIKREKEDTLYDRIINNSTSLLNLIGIILGLIISVYAIRESYKKSKKKT